MEIYLSFIAAILSVLSITLSAYFSLYTKKHNAFIRNKVTKGLQKAFEALQHSRKILELNLNKHLDDAKNKLVDSSEKIQTFKIQYPDEDDSIYEQQFNVTVENLLNQYEIYCDFYLSNSIDQERFEKQKYLEIKQIIEDENLSEYLNKKKNDYEAIFQVYKRLKEKNII